MSPGVSGCLLYKYSRNKCMNYELLWVMILEHLGALFAQVKDKFHDYCEDWPNDHRDSHQCWPYDEILFCLLFSVPDTTRCHVLITNNSDSADYYLYFDFMRCCFVFLPCKFWRVFWQLDKVLSLELFLDCAFGGGEHLAEPKQRGHRTDEDKDESLSRSWTIPRGWL